MLLSAVLSDASTGATGNQFLTGKKLLGAVLGLKECKRIFARLTVILASHKLETPLKAKLKQSWRQRSGLELQ